MPQESDPLAALALSTACGAVRMMPNAAIVGIIVKVRVALTIDILFPCERCGRNTPVTSNAATDRTKFPGHARWFLDVPGLSRDSLFDGGQRNAKLSNGS